MGNSHRLLKWELWNSYFYCCLFLVFALISSDREMNRFCNLDISEPNLITSPPLAASPAWKTRKLRNQGKCSDCTESESDCSERGSDCEWARADKDGISAEGALRLSISNRSFYCNQRLTKTRLSCLFASTFAFTAVSSTDFEHCIEYVSVRFAESGNSLKIERLDELCS